MPDGVHDLPEPCPLAYAHHLRAEDLAAEVRRLRALEAELLDAAAEWMRLGSVDGSDAQRTLWEAGSDLHYLLTAKPGEFTRAALDPT